MFWARALVLALVWPLGALAETSVVDLRAMVVAGKTEPVEAVLRDAMALDQIGDVEPDAERALFELFTDTQPEINAFTQRWLTDQPGNALAMTARGWHLYAQGWNMRGKATVRNVFPDAMAAMMALHNEADHLADAALAAEPELIAASDLKLMLTTTLGNTEIIPVEMERVMTLHPNRGSLMRVMASLAPQWGGSPAQVKLLCDRYAPLIRSVPGYDVQVCAIDAVYFGNFWDGGQRDEAHQLLMLTPNPVLDYARLMDAVSGYGPPQQRVKVLEKLKANRALDTTEAMALDSARAEIAGGLNTQDEWKIALAEAIKWRREGADHDPHDPLVVTNYVASAIDANDNLGPALDADDLKARLKRLLAKVPYSAPAWQLLGELTSREVPFGQVDLDKLAEREPYYINAVVYSNYDYNRVAAMIRGKFWAIIDPENVLRARDISGLSPTELQRLDAVVHCPMMRQYKILQIVCMNEGISADQCGDFPAGQDQIVARLREVVGRGACQEEVTRDHADLAYSPIAIDFSAAP